MKMRTRSEVQRETRSAEDMQVEAPEKGIRQERGHRRLENAARADNERVVY